MKSTRPSQVGTLGTPAELVEQALALGAERLAGHGQPQLRQLARRERHGLERQVRALPGLDRTQQQHPLPLGRRRRPEALEVDAGVDHAQPLTELAARVEVARDALRRHHDQLGLARAAAQRAGDQRTGQQVVVLAGRACVPGAAAGIAVRPARMPHATTVCGRSERRSRAQLGGLSREPAQRRRALGGAATQLEAALAQLEDADSALARGVRERSRRAGDQRRLLEPGGHLEQDALGAAEDARVADCDRRHAGAS